jgi:hypothetical protein
MQKTSKQVSFHCRKFKAEVKKLGLNLSVVLLILVVFVLIIITAVFHSQRQTYRSKASNCPYLPTNAGRALCETNCANQGGCTTCVGGGGYTCKNSIPGIPNHNVTNNPGNSNIPGPQGLPACSGPFYRNASGCIYNCGANNCRECSRYGSGGYYECAKNTKPPSNITTTPPANVTTTPQTVATPTTSQTATKPSVVRRILGEMIKKLFGIYKRLP